MDELPASGERCRRSGRCRIPRTTSTRCARRCPPRSRPPASTPEQVVGIATDFTATTPLPVLRRRHAAVPGAGSSAPARLPEAVEAPRRAAPRRPHQRRRRGARRAVARALRRAHLLRVGVRQGAAGARRGPGALRARDRWIEAADWIVWQLCGRETRNVCTAGYKGDPPGRRATRRTDFLRALDERFADFVAAKLDGPLVAARRARRRPHGAGGGVDRPATAGSRSRSATSTRTSPRPRPARSTRARC